MNTPEQPGFLRSHGNCQALLAFQKAEVVLRRQTNYLVGQQVRRLEEDFVKAGGLRERMTRGRLKYREGSNRSQGPHGSHGAQDSTSAPEPPPAR